MTNENKNIDLQNKDGSLKYKKAMAILREAVETVFVVLVLVILIRNFLGEPRWIPSASMRPTLIEGDRLIIEKVSGFLSMPKRGDILVFYPPTEELGQSYWSKFTRLIGYFNSDTAFIKRVIGVPGDKIFIKDGVGVFVNGKLLKEPYIQQLNKFRIVQQNKPIYSGPMIVPKNEYFMMGDNRGDSLDSRFWGFLPKDRIIGKAYFRFWPINRIGLIDHPKY